MNIDKRLMEIEKELRQLYDDADTYAQLTSNRSSLECDWFWAEVNYSFIANLAADLSQKCGKQLYDFRKWDQEQKRKYEMDRSS